MSAFIGYGEVGVWMTNGERDIFLDWYAAHRCQPHDSRWEYCMSPGQRWPGCCIELDELIPRGEVFTVSGSERADAATDSFPGLARLLDVIAQMTRDEWKHSISSEEARHWRDA